MTNTLQNKIKALIEPLVVALGYELWGLELFSQGKRTSLRVYIECIGTDKDRLASENGNEVVVKTAVTIDDCSRVSHQISALFDVEDPIAGRYDLEVSSPGMDRRLFNLEQYARYIGEKILVRLVAPEMGRKNYTGKLLAVENEAVHLEVDGNTITLPIEHIEKAHLALEF